MSPMSPKPEYAFNWGKNLLSAFLFFLQLQEEANRSSPVEQTLARRTSSRPNCAGHTRWLPDQPPSGSSRAPSLSPCAHAQHVPGPCATVAAVETETGDERTVTDWNPRTETIARPRDGDGWPRGDPVANPREADHWTVAPVTDQDEKDCSRASKLPACCAAKGHKTPTSIKLEIRRICRK